VAGWLNERIPLASLHAPATVSRPGYGWAEFIERRPPASPAEVTQFSLRSGVLLAALYALDAAGIHDGMLTPSGGQPVLTDVTAFFRPSATVCLADPCLADPAAEFLAASVDRTGLLPTAGLGDRPAAGGQAPEPADAEFALLDGFRLGYAAIADNRDEFASLIESARDLEARGDWPHRGQHLPDVPDQPRPDLALDKLGHLSEVDRRDQEWIISAALATAWPAHGHRSAEPLPTPLAGVAAEPSRLLTTACGLADQIVSRGMSSRPGNGPARVNWLGLQMDASAQWVVAPMDAGLADGYVGVALFLAQLADLTGIGRYAEVARLAVSPIPAWLVSMKGQPEPSPALRGAGFDGLGGISYGLARMATLFHETQVGEWADTAVELASATRDPADPPGWADGSAGCLAAMTATHSELGSPRAQALAMVTADRLAEFVDRADGWCPPEGAPPPVGFATGPAGIGWALARFAVSNGKPAYLSAGRRAARLAVGRAGISEDRLDGWCRGTAGLLLAKSLLADEASTGRLRADLLALGERPVLRDLSLCHGESGIAEVFSVLSPAERGGSPSYLLRHRAALLLDAMQRHSRYCGTPGGVSTPGLLYGLAGIGYGLLRLGFPGRVPAVLLMEPTPATEQA
jgi:lantibiotic modifying enzyme